MSRGVTTGAALEAGGAVFNQEHRHTSLIATLREQWSLGDPLTARDAAARTFSQILGTVIVVRRRGLEQRLWAHHWTVIAPCQ
jgi:hypothetical protein